MSSKSPIQCGQGPQICTRSRNMMSNLKISKQIETNNNITDKKTLREQAKIFFKWYQNLFDDERNNIILYLADNVILEWFGRTIRDRKNVSGYLRYDMHCSKHDFTTIDICSPFTVRCERSRNESISSIGESGDELAKPLESCDTPATKLKNSLLHLTMRGSSLKKSLRPGLRSNSSSPEYGINKTKHQLDNSEVTSSAKKRFKPSQFADAMEYENKYYGDQDVACKQKLSHLRRQLNFDEPSKTNDVKSVSQTADGIVKFKHDLNKTPPNREIGQGDCQPSTSGINRLFTANDVCILSQLPRKYVEAKGFIEFTRTRNKRGADILKWERQCKVQISYLDDPINVGEYIIFSIIYSDNNKCRRNLLSAFEEVARETETAKIAEATCLRQ